jgi:hypothetical protein
MFAITHIDSEPTNRRMIEKESAEDFMVIRFRHHATGLSIGKRDRATTARPVKSQPPPSPIEPLRNVLSLEIIQKGSRDVSHQKVAGRQTGLDVAEVRRDTHPGASSLLQSLQKSQPNIVEVMARVGATRKAAYDEMDAYGRVMGGHGRKG